MLFIGDEGDECVPTSQRSCSTVWNDDDEDQWDETDRFSASKIVSFLSFPRANYHRGIQILSEEFGRETLLCRMELRNRELLVRGGYLIPENSREREIDYDTWIKVENRFFSNKISLRWGDEQRYRGPRNNLFRS